MPTSPVLGYVSSKYGWRTLARKPMFHAGLDIATGGVLRDVHAMYAGTVERTVTNRKPGNRGGDSYAPGRTPNYVAIRNPDGELQFYGHCLASVKKGQKVSEGQKIGRIDLSGNTTGAHCHLETWDKNNKTHNPIIHFNKHGIKPGSAPKTSDGGSPSVEKGFLDMDEDKAEAMVERAVWTVLNRPITLGAETAKRYGSKTAPLYALIRDAAYGYTEVLDTPRKVWMYELKVAGQTAKQLGADTINAIMALRYAAANLFDSRARDE